MNLKIHTQLLLESWEEKSSRKLNQWLQGGTEERAGDRKRLLDRIRLAPGDECWTWTGYRNSLGYGTFRMSNDKSKPAGTNRMAHRMMHWACFGPIPNGLCICHKCDNPPCIRPDHLFLGTQIENCLDRDRKGRVHRGKTQIHIPHSQRKLIRGEDSKSSKLKEYQVREIRSSSLGNKALGKIYGVSDRTIYAIRYFKKWAYLK